MCVGVGGYARIWVYVGEGIVTLWNSGSYARRAVSLLQLSRSNCLDTSDLRRCKKLKCYAQTCAATGGRGCVYAFRCACAVVLLCNKSHPSVLLTKFLEEVYHTVPQRVTRRYLK
jgi:hypothetical protein